MSPPPVKRRHQQQVATAGTRTPAIHLLTHTTDPVAALHGCARSTRWCALRETISPLANHGRHSPLGHRRRCGTLGNDHPGLKPHEIRPTQSDLPAERLRPRRTSSWHATPRRARARFAPASAYAAKFDRKSRSAERSSSSVVRGRPLTGGPGLYHLGAVADGTRAGVPAARPDRPTPSTPQAGVTGRAVRHRSDVRPPLARKMPKGRA